jgi:hypothetical protein
MRPRDRRIPVLVIAAASLVGCGSAYFGNLPLAPKQIRRFSLPAPVEDSGGMGSGLAWDPASGEFWTVSDRHPEHPEWGIYIFRLRIAENKVEIAASIRITKDRRKLTGNDYDLEGIAITPDGKLWLCDESGPYLIRVNRQGEVLEEVLVRDLTEREDNRGFEGVAVDPTGTTIYAILQNGMKSEKDKLNTIIAAYEISTRTCKFYRYRLEAPEAYEFPKGLQPPPRTGAHDIWALDKNFLLVLERDNQSGENALIKRIFKIQLPSEPDPTPVPKTMVLDLKKHGYLHEAPEGLAIRGSNFIYVINDNDRRSDIPTELWEIEY